MQATQESTRSAAMLIVAVALLSGANAEQEKAPAMKLAKTSLTLTTVYDNYATKEGLETRHGFGCLVEADGRKILFDTGGDGEVLTRNAKALGIDFQDVAAVVLSHVHDDHTGGLGAVLAVNPTVTVWMPASFPGPFKDRVKAAGARVHEVHEAETLSPAVATTGEMGRGIIEARSHDQYA